MTRDELLKEFDANLSLYVQRNAAIIYDNPHSCAALEDKIAYIVSDLVIESLEDAEQDEIEYGFERIYSTELIDHLIAYVTQTKNDTAVRSFYMHELLSAPVELVEGMLNHQDKHLEQRIAEMREYYTLPASKMKYFMARAGYSAAATLDKNRAAAESDDPDFASLRTLLLADENKFEQAILCEHVLNTAARLVLMHENLRMVRQQLNTAAMDDRSVQTPAVA